MISLEHQMAILADIELNYKEEMLKGNWKEFFNTNNVGIPLATLITLELADFPHDQVKKFYSETLIRKTFVDFCNELGLDPKTLFTTAEKMFQESPNEIISEENTEV